MNITNYRVKLLFAYFTAAVFWTRYIIKKSAAPSSRLTGIFFYFRTTENSNFCLHDFSEIKKIMSYRTRLIAVFRCEFVAKISTLSTNFYWHLNLVIILDLFRMFAVGDKSCLKAEERDALCNNKEVYMGFVRKSMHL